MPKPLKRPPGSPRWGSLGLDEWWVRWVGRQTPEGTNAPCYWLFREVYQTDLGIALPAMGTVLGQARWRRMILDGLVAWDRVDQPRDRDGVLLDLPGELHMGLWVPDDRLLHLGRRMAGAAVQHLDLYRRRGFLKGIYRLRSSVQPTRMRSST